MSAVTETVLTEGESKALEEHKQEMEDDLTNSIPDVADAAVAADLDQEEEKNNLVAVKRDAQEMDPMTTEDSSDDILGRYPIKKMKYEATRDISAPLFEKIRKGIYFNCCPCDRLLNFPFFERVGCICRLLMYGVEGYPNLRYFKGCQVLFNHHRANPKTIWEKAE
ncbi:MAG TPA: hypothetical protein VK133_02865 [Amoebophilaceae bacterium]|nr:hypothetical protein [Amoebophilaceae bacterium]